MPVDLRWGLTNEDTSDAGLGALEHCLREVDRTRPFCVVLSGERYGWIPPNYRVSDDPSFDWVRNHPHGSSITAMEVQHAFLRKPYTPVHAFNYVRDPSFTDTHPDDPDVELFKYTAAVAASTAVGLWHTCPSTHCVCCCVLTVQI